MPTNTNEMSAYELRVQASEMRQLEAELMAQLDSLPFRIKEAQEAEKTRYNVQQNEVMAGRSNNLPTLNFAEAEALEATEPDLRARAKQAGLDKYQLAAMADALEEAEHQATYDSLAKPERELEAEKARIDKELEELRWARHAANSKREAATKERLANERAYALHSQSDEPIRRIV